MNRLIRWPFRRGEIFQQSEVQRHMSRSAGALERDTILRDLTPGFTIHQGEGYGSPFVFCSPHSGRTYPDSFLDASRLTPATIRKSEDSFVDDLFTNVTTLGAPLIAARFPRAYLDLNREPFELDPLLFAEPLPEFANTRSIRVLSGLGTLARVVADNEAIYHRPLSVDVAFERIARLYRPFHAALTQLLEQRRQAFGQAILIDCHSMPSSNSQKSGPARPDMILGDRFGMSCHSELTLAMHQALQNVGFEVALNRPYAGGFITEHYGRPADGIQAIQIEINRALYMNETRLEMNRSFRSVQASMDDAMARVTAAYPHLIRPAEAAE